MTSGVKISTSPKLRNLKVCWIAQQVDDPPWLLPHDSHKSESHSGVVSLLQGFS